MPKKPSYQQEQPIKEYPFEVLYKDSWCSVQQLRVKDGNITTHFEHHGLIIEDKVPSSNPRVANLRIRSRKAKSSDCIFFLRPGIDVCVLSKDPSEANACGDNPRLEWVDAKINSIEKEPHEFGCNCRFRVSLKGARKPYHKDSKMQEISIDKIAILQQFYRKPHEDGHFRWICSKDCPTETEVKLLRGQFMHDISWMIVVSILERVEFVIRSVQNKVLYQILDGGSVIGSSGSGPTVKALNFKFEDSVLKPKISTFVLQLPTETTDAEETMNTEPIHIEDNASGTFSAYDVMCLRRSKRKNLQPDRFVGDGFSKVKYHAARAKTERTRKREEADLQCIFLSDSDSDGSVHSDSSKHITRSDAPLSDVDSEEHPKRDANSAARKRARDEPGEVQHPESNLENRSKKLKDSICVPLLTYRPLLEVELISSREVHHSKSVPKNHNNGVERSSCAASMVHRTLLIDVPIVSGEVERLETVSSESSKWVDYPDSAPSMMHGFLLTDVPIMCGEVRHSKYVVKKHNKRAKSAVHSPSETHTGLLEVDPILYGEVQHSKSVSEKSNKEAKYSFYATSATERTLLIDEAIFCGEFQHSTPVPNDSNKEVTDSVFAPLKTHKNPPGGNHMTESTTASKRPSDEKEFPGKVQQSIYPSKQASKKIGSNFLVDSRYAMCGKTVQDQANKHNDNACTVSSKTVKSASKKKKKKKSISKRKKEKLEKKLKKTGSSKEFRSKSSLPSKRVYVDARTYRRRTLTKSEINQIIQRCWKNIESETSKPQQPAVCQWDEILSYQWWKLPQQPPQPSPVNDPAENLEIEELWNEMESSMRTFQCHQQKLPEDIADAKYSRINNGQSCQHQYVLDEEIGTICQCCRSVGVEIRYMSPCFFEKNERIRVTGYDKTKSEGGHRDDLELNLLDNPASSNGMSMLDQSRSVWALIPNLRDKMRAHQKSAYEFLWRNIAGSLVPAEMDASSRKTGGCVIAHSPGAGKTLLMISFLISYLRLFPSGRPLILAPKTTLHAWYKEFKKWKVSVPIYQIFPRRDYRKDLKNKQAQASPGTLNQYVRHTLDCLEKFENWHKHASVLLMSYPSFLSIMRGSSGLEHFRYLANILQRSPGLVVLDEGHNPRSTLSTLRKTLMQVKTKHRILLSGTLFQNTFEEYFNTLCLARPGFISEVLTALDPTPRRVHFGNACLRNYKEKRARKFFMEEIARRVKSKVDEKRRKGLNILKNISSGFIDVYEGGASDSLPGLQNYVLMIKPTMFQQEYMELVQKNGSCRTGLLELEILTTLVSIHPWLITTLRYSSKYYSPEELEKLKLYKLDILKGSKVRFVVNLVSRCIIKEEKVLIFCRYISTIELLAEIFVHRFGWTNGEDILQLYGDQELCERSRVIDKFEEPGGPSQVLIVSISACSEGISLAAASRVIFLDSEWNPSKTKQAVARAFRPGQKKVVYVYQLLASGTIEEDKYQKNTWKENVSRMLFVGEGAEDLSWSQAEDIDDSVLKEIVEADNGQLIHMVMKDESLFSRSDKGKEAALLSLK